MVKRYQEKSGFLLCILIAGFFLIFPATVFPELPERLKFESFTNADGLSHNSVFCILQDSRGFLWLGTENGLNRYDGYGFKIYEPDPSKPESISGIVIRALLEDSRGDLWVGTNNGLDRFNRKTETFDHFRYDENNDDTLSNNTVTAIYEDPRDTLWIGTAGGLNKFDRYNRTFTRYLHDEKNENSLSNDKISVIYEDRQGTLWVATSDGLNRFIREKGEFFRTKKIEGGGNIKAFIEDRTGELWIGSYGGGLNRYHPQADTFSKIMPISPGSPNKFSGDKVNKVLAIFEDLEENILWIGTYGYGLYRRNLKTGEFHHYSRISGISTSLSNDRVYSIFKDRGGIIWIGTESGLNKLDKRKTVFRHWEEEPGKDNSLKGNPVFSFHEDHSNIIWIGTDGGLHKFDIDKGIFTRYLHNLHNPRSLSSDKVLVIYKDKQDGLWVGTESGLNKLDRETETFSHYLTKQWVKAIYEQKPGILWVATSEALYKSGENYGKFTPVEKQESGLFSLAPGGVNCLLEDKTNDILWIGTEEEGLNRYRFQAQTEKLKTFMHDPNDSGTISDNNIRCLYLDNSGNLWIGTFQGGLNRFDSESGKLERIQGIPNTICGILEDDSGNLWISTAKGLVRYNANEKDETNKVKLYDLRDGLQSNEFNGNACLKTADGMLFFGGINGFNAFYPHEVKDSSYSPPLVITDFQALNKPYFIDESVTEKKEFSFSHREYVYTFKFASLDFSAPGKIRYRYKMDRDKNDWLYTDADQRFATYTNMTPGHHTFWFQGTNSDGNWGSEHSVKVYISPPYWQTWWFRTILVFLALASLVGGYLLRTRNLREKIAEQERIQQVLRQSRDEMERARDLAEIRSAENEKLITAISALFIAVDSNGAVFQLNIPAAEFFGIDRSDALNKPFTNVFKDSIKPGKLIEIIEKGIDPERASKEIEFSVDLKSQGKGIKLLLASVSTIMDRSGKKLGFLLLAEDITNRKEEEMLRNLSKKLESVGQMASGIAHEIKTPLQYIGHNARFVTDSFGHLVQFYETVIERLPELEKTGQKELVEKLKHLADLYDLEYIMEEIPVASEQMIDGVERVADIISAMNEFSHPGKGFKEKTDINRLLKTTLVMVQNRIKKNAEVRFKLNNELPHIPCYPAELNQVFLNLLVNALDAIMETQRPGLITLTTVVDSEDVVISISDTGCGIPVENIDHIFNPFFTTKDVGKGTGQGLSLVHNVIVERHGGKLDLASKSGIGTTFNIRLPIEGEN